MTSGENDEEAAWLDLIAHYDAPAEIAGGRPWPERENLAETDSAAFPGAASPGAALPGASIPGVSQVTRSPQAPDSPPGPEGPQAKGARPAPADPPFGADLTAPGLEAPGGDAPVPPPVSRPPGAHGAHGGAGAHGPEMQEEHYFPPPPPPLPKLDPVTKGAWAALFGGPAYLLIATAVGWTVPAVAAFFAIGAFVGGFAVLVMRMGDEPRDGNGPDDGAVV